MKSPFSTGSASTGSSRDPWGSRGGRDPGSGGGCRPAGGPPGWARGRRVGPVCVDLRRVYIGPSDRLCPIDSGHAASLCVCACVCVCVCVCLCVLSSTYFFFTSSHHLGKFSSKSVGKGISCERMCPTQTESPGFSTEEEAVLFHHPFRLTSHPPATPGCVSRWF